VSLSIVVLAAGQGTRMKSTRPKVVHEVAGEPMLRHVLAVARQLAPARMVVVVGYGADQVRAAVGNGVEFMVQAEQLGTGHAVLQARDGLAGVAETVMVLYGDTPLITPQTLGRLLEHHQATRPALTALTCHMPDPTGYGRVLRDARGRVLGVVEEAAATPEQRALTESNMGFYCFDDGWLWDRLERLPLSAGGEYYLTDLVESAVREGSPVETVLADDPVEVQGINTRLQLAEVEARLHDRIRRRWMLDGVTLIDPATVWIDAGVEIGVDTIIYPNTYLKGHTVVGRECQLGPDTWIEDSILGDRCQVRFSVFEGATLEDDVDVGPFAHLRTGAHLARGVHLGNFGEVKNSTLGRGTKMGHFSYVGDATIGEDVNIGAGTITCNFDGVRKHRTVIEDGAFIGSDTMLVAPVRVGAGAKTGAGSVVTRDVPAGALVYGVPARVREDDKVTR
jgi:bifunctional UDP-N-acetylglucosamine pyrophosphorylase/glucosamine-1-phosphate N-acetyltransferase